MELPPYCSQPRTPGNCSQPPRTRTHPKCAYVPHKHVSSRCPHMRVCGAHTCGYTHKRASIDARLWPIHTSVCCLVPPKPLSHSCSTVSCLVETLFQPLQLLFGVIRVSSVSTECEPETKHYKQQGMKSKGHAEMLSLRAMPNTMTSSFHSSRHALAKLAPHQHQRDATCNMGWPSNLNLRPHAEAQ